MKKADPTLLREDHEYMLNEHKLPMSELAHNIYRMSREELNGADFSSLRVENGRDFE